MTDIIEAETVKAPSTVDVYLVMARRDHDRWYVDCQSYLQHEAIDHATTLSERGKVCRIVRVSGLPVDVAKGEV